jgi:predicted RNase H-like HicB family nuclease
MDTPIQNNDIQAKSYSFRVVIEPDKFEDGRPAYHVFCPALQQYGASTWGNTEEEALKSIQEVVQMIVEELVEDGIAIPEGPREEVVVFTEPRVSVTV